jgi:hypothetical protein
LAHSEWDKGRFLLHIASEKLHFGSEEGTLAAAAVVDEYLAEPVEVVAVTAVAVLVAVLAAVAVAVLAAVPVAVIAAVGVVAVEAAAAGVAGVAAVGARVVFLWQISEWFVFTLVMYEPPFSTC